MNPLWTGRWCLAVTCASLVAFAAGCERETRDFTSPPAPIEATKQSRLTPQQPVTLQDTPVAVSTRPPRPYEDRARDVSDGKRLFSWYNCNGCHGLAGGGGMGPALMDNEWIYGREPAQVYETIARGRPHGMPSFGGHIPDDQIWKLVAYVRSMSGLLPSDVAPGRADALLSTPAEQRRSSGREYIKDTPR